MRCDVNVSVKPVGRKRFGTKVEVKNMNSFNAMARAIDYEIERQEKLYKEGRGDEIVQETRTWDDQNQRTVTMRKKRRLGGLPILPGTGFKSSRLFADVRLERSKGNARVAERNSRQIQSVRITGR
jgi:aspartyl-tRNA(Asn)/glutamyl-tRNA(Gln) amidotransferase subunit B